MNKISLNIQRNFLGVPLSFLFLMCMFLMISRIISADRIGIIAMLSLVYISGFVSLNYLRINRLTFFYFIIVLYNITLVILFPSYTSLYHFVVQAISFGFIVFLSNGDINENYLSKLTNYFYKFYMIFSLIFVFAIFTGNVNMNGGTDTFLLGLYQPLFVFSFFVFLKTKVNFAIGLWMATIPFLSGERGLAICIIIVMGVYLLLGFLKKSKLLYNLFFWFIALIVSSYQFVYVWASKNNIGILLNEISRKYSNQNFFSGREKIWDITNLYITDSPIIGYGLGNNILESNFIEISAHNTYVDILLSGGIVSLILFFSFIYSIWNRMFPYINDKAVRLSMSFLISILFFGDNGVILIGNDISFSLLIWVIIGVGIMKSNFLKAKNEQFSKI